MNINQVLWIQIYHVHQNNWNRRKSCWAESDTGRQILYVLHYMRWWNLWEKTAMCVIFAASRVFCRNFLKHLPNILREVVYFSNACSSQSQEMETQCRFPMKGQRPNYLSHCLPPSQAVHQQKLDSQWSWDMNPGILTWYRYVPSSILTATLNTCPLSPFKRVFKVHKLHVDF